MNKGYEKENLDLTVNEDYAKKLTIKNKRKELNEAILYEVNRMTVEEMETMKDSLVLFKNKK